MSQEHYKKRLKALMDRPENQVCSDCPERQPRWASLIVPPPGSPPGMLPMGAFCCLECSGSHRRLGVHVSFVRSITLDQWKENEVLAMENGGNKKVNAIYEAKLHDTSVKPNHHASGQVRERFIRDKYERRKYFDPAVLHRIVTLGDDSLLANSSSDRDSKKEEFSEASSNSSASARQPSEAARLRAENRRNRLPNTSSSSFSDSSSNKPTIVQIPPKVNSTTTPSVPVQPIIDLLDFSSIPTSSVELDPPPLPPSLQASPNLDLFKSLNVNEPPIHTTSTTAIDYTGDIFGDIYNRKTSNASSASNPFSSPQVEEKKNKMTSDEILAMFNTSSSAVSNAPMHTSTSTPNFVVNHAQSRFDFFNNIATPSVAGSSSSSSTTNPLLQTHHSFSSSSTPSGIQGGSTSHTIPTTNNHVGLQSFMSYPATSTLNMNDKNSFSMTNAVTQPGNMGYNLQGMTPSLLQPSGMSFGAVPVQPNVVPQNFMPVPLPSLVPPPMPSLSSTHLNMAHTQQNPSSFTPGLDTGMNQFQLPMGGATGNFSIMGGGVESTAAFGVMGGTYGNENASNQNSNNFGALNSFR